MSASRLARSLALAWALGALGAPTLAPLAQAQGGGACANCGTVIAIDSFDSEQQLTSLGMVSPGTLAGDNGTGQSGRVTAQFAIGRGFTNDGMVLLGSAGGVAYARTPANAPQKRWEVTVRMDDGTRRSLRQSYPPTLAEGDRVRVYGTQLELVGH
jgi:outer membrane lipoprotein SlyB